MIEEDGCWWCAAWNDEIGSIYPKTAEGRAAPLERHDIHTGPPPGVTLARPARYTPTFVLARDGAEVGRIEGYPGEDFFWALLEQLFAKADTPSKPAG